jgi:chromosome segregation ATPase
MTQDKNAPPKGARIHKDMFRGLTSGQVDDLIAGLTAELKALQSAAAINHVMLAENQSHLRTTKRRIADLAANLRAMKEAPIILLEEHRHVSRRLNGERGGLRDLEKSQRRLIDEKTQLSQRIISVSEAILWGNEAATRASPVLTGNFRGRSPKTELGP